MIGDRIGTRGEAWDVQQDVGWQDRLRVWWQWRLGLGWPHAGGWGDQLAWVWMTVSAFEAAARTHEAEQQRKRNERTG